MFNERNNKEAETIIPLNWITKAKSIIENKN